MPRRSRPHPLAIVAIYLVAVALSNLVQSLTPREGAVPPASKRFDTVIHAMTDTGPTDNLVTLSYLEFDPPPTRQLDRRPPVILIHGSPGQAANFSALGPTLAASGRRAYAIDMPGFGMSSEWVPSYSARAYARTVLAFMDDMHIERAHVLGWSNGGAVALNIADLAPVDEQDHPDRLASLTLLAAIASQETEGSGSYVFEHAKYAIGYAALVVLPEFLPHFGLLGPRSFRHAFIRNFWDTDQRPLRDVMQSLTVPVLILHGQHDPLVAPWAAERHHELIPTSRLIMTPYSHFLPFLQPEETAETLERFFALHDTPGILAQTGTLDLAPSPVRPRFDALVRTVQALHWITAAAIFAGLARLRRETATALAGLLVAAAAIDFGVACVGLFIGRALHPREPWLRKDLRWAIGLPVWTAISLFIAQLLTDEGTPVPGLLDAPLGPLSLPIALGLVAVILNTIKLAPTRPGRRRITATVRRFTHHEWWPAPLLYLLIAPHLLRLAIRHRSLTCWTCVNPGITPGGGINGESKQAILRGFNDPRILTQHTIGAHENDRAARALELIRAEPTLGGFPVIIKPDAGQRGAGVTLVRTEAELDAAINSNEGSVCIQRYHPGPVELGVFWTRDPATIGNERTDSAQGSIFSVTRKVFPAVTGDGRSTLRDLVLAHPRDRIQAAVYLQQLGPRAGTTPESGELVRLSAIGNHARGCRFEDGADLITPQLAEAIDTMARTWRGPGGERFDIGRFDLRSSSDESVRTATDLAVIELNGVTSEATNLYDPGWSAFRALGVLANQWSIAFELGATRRRAGVTPMGIIAIMRAALRPGRSGLEP